LWFFNWLIRFFFRFGFFGYFFFQFSWFNWFIGFFAHPYYAVIQKYHENCFRRLLF
jgi:hypothetical protein